VGRSESVLVDAQYIDSDIAALGNLIESTGTKLTTIYVTHAHADHYLGIGALLERFPGARPLATPEVVEAIEATLDGQARKWSAMFGDAAVKPTVLPEPMAGDAIDGPDEWQNWIPSVNQVERLRPATIVAGHKKPEATDQAVEEMINGTRSYISDFAEAAQSAKDADELVAMMLSKYETFGNPWTLKFSAGAWFARDRP
jgi:Metallo-beta-lactamase superfamily